jgi:hypothetical protein
MVFYRDGNRAGMVASNILYLFRTPFSELNVPAVENRGKPGQ